jgi:hypothetical protein
MNEKIRLKDGMEFDLIPMGIVNKDKVRIFKFITELPYEDILLKFTDTNIEEIKYILADNSIGATYEDCVTFKSLTFVPNVQIDDNTVSDIYIVVLSTDAVERGMQTLKEQMVDIVNTVVMMSMPMM